MQGRSAPIFPRPIFMFAAANGQRIIELSIRPSPSTSLADLKKCLFIQLPTEVVRIGNMAAGPGKDALRGRTDHKM
jgi:hypothetical protein